MGEVYLAEDTRLDRKVAIKFLPQDSTADEHAKRRLIREARAVAKLDHPNVCSIYEVAEKDGRAFIVMQHVEGETLADRIRRGPIELREALAIVIQVADALSEAHTHGIIHRDIKPANIMLTSRSQVKVMDFGLAKEVRARSVAESEAVTKSLLTDPGMVVGTVPYMSPEQVRGLDVDERTDIFSLGVVLYEMASGRRPFRGESSGDIIAAILKDDPPPLAHFEPETPAEFQRIVSKTLRKVRDERYQSAKELLVDLKTLRDELSRQMRREYSTGADSGERQAPQTAGGTAVSLIPDRTAASGIILHRTTAKLERLISRIQHRKRAALGAIVILVLASAGLVAYYIRAKQPPPQKASETSLPIKSMAVLPFKPLAADKRDESLEMGMAETLITSLSNLSQLTVRPITAVRNYTALDTNSIAAGRELQVEAVLYGHMQMASGRIRITVHFARVTDEAPLWSAKFDDAYANIFDLQDSISEKVVTALALKLTGEERKRLARRYTDDTEAYQLYQKGRFHWNKFTEEGFRKAIEYFKQAVEKDPAYALAYSGIADSYSMLGELSYAPPEEVFPQARRYAEQALALDDALAEAHIALGIVKLVYEWNWPQAEVQLRRAKELSPNYSEAYHFYAHYLQTVGRADEAIREMRRGAEMDPTSLILNSEVGFTYYCARRYDEAIAQYRKTLELDPSFAFASVLIAQAYQQQRMYQESIAELRKVRVTSADWSWVLAELGCYYAALGKRVEAQKIIEELGARRTREYIDPVLICYIYIALGDKDKAFWWLEKGFAERAGLMTWITVEPKFDPLRNDARFAHLLRRMGFAL